MAEKEIRIKIKSIRYEVSASLFAGVDLDDIDNDMAIFDDIDPEPEVIEINTVGKKRLENSQQIR